MRMLEHERYSGMRALKLDISGDRCGVLEHAGYMCFRC